MILALKALLKYIIAIPYFVIFFVLGIAMCCTIVLIPFGIQFLKLSKVAPMPYRYVVETDYSLYPVLNVIWDVTFGLILSLYYLLFGIVCCVTVLCIPVGVQSFKVMKLAIAPFGAKVTRDWYR